MSEHERPYIVVGVDGSDSSKDALRWADRQAELTGARLHAITTWEMQPTYPYPVIIDARLGRAVLRAPRPVPAGHRPQPGLRGVM
jgi:nucleotide-binding universal stress UspA family protein